MRIKYAIPMLLALAIGASACSSSESSEASDTSVTSLTEGTTDTDTAPTTATTSEAGGEPDGPSTETTAASSSPADDELDESSQGAWTLSRLVIDGIEIDVPPNIQLVINNDTIQGTTGCNTFNGTVSLGESNPAGLLNDFSSGTEACETDALTQFEEDYLPILESVVSLSVRSSEMDLAGPGMAAVYFRS